MPKLLVAVDGSANAHHAVDYVIRHASWYRDPVHVHLLNVQWPLAGVNVKMFIREESLNAYYHDEGEAALKNARVALEAAGIAYTPHIGVGDPGRITVEFARDQGCDHIVVGTRGLGAVSSMILGSVATKIVHVSPLPVILVK
jgi:nucleotide-binding universal stress UspA family protein